MDDCAWNNCPKATIVPRQKLRKTRHYICSKIYLVPSYGNHYGYVWRQILLEILTSDWCGALIPDAQIQFLMCKKCAGPGPGRGCALLIAHLRHRRNSRSFFQTCLVFLRSPQYILYDNCQKYFKTQRSTSTAKFVTCTTLQTSFQHPNV